MAVLIAVGGVVFSLFAHETRQGSVITPIPAVCWIAAVFLGQIPAAMITSGVLLTGLMCHHGSKPLRNLFLSYIPSTVLIILISNEISRYPAATLILIPAGILLQFTTAGFLNGFRSRDLATVGIGWVINSIASYAVYFFLRENGFAGGFLVLTILMIFDYNAALRGGRLLYFSGRIGTLSIQNRLMSYVYREETPYPLYFFDGGQVWTMQGRPAHGVPNPGEAPQEDTPGEWSFYPLGRSVFIASGRAADEMSSLPGRELQETLLILETIWRASFTKRRLENAFLGAAGMLVRIADKKDSDTHRHSIRVSQTAVKLGKILGLSETELFQLRIGAILHDIGKLAIPAALLNKKKLLTEEERRIIETHPTAGARLLAPMERYGKVSSAVLQHHERINGSGYPMGIKGHEISLHARIVAVADAFDAIISPRSYHLGKPSHIAMREIARYRGTHFDAAVVDALEEMLR